MSKRLTPKEIKHDIREDEFRSFVSRAADKLQENPSLVVGAIAGILAVILIGVGVTTYLEAREEKANDLLTEALEIYRAPIIEADAKPDDPKERSFANEEERQARAKEALAKVGAGPASEVAELYLAEIALAEGDTETARKTWEKFLANNEDHILSLSVRLNLIQLDRDNGQEAEVAELLERELASSKKSMPEDVILYELAVTREALEQTDEAVELYQRILDEYPESPYTSKARQMTTSLG